MAVPDPPKPPSSAADSPTAPVALPLAGGARELPVIGGAPEERVDAARNRARILAAAACLFARNGVASTSMDAIAREAGVGKGTLFRRFGDRASLALALLQDAERRFQDHIIRGPAPLGPGAPPQERVIAFGRALLAHVTAHAELLLAAERGGAPGRRYDVGAYGVYRTHLTMLVAEAAPELDAAYTADALLAPLAVELVLHQMRGRGMSLDQLARGWEALARRTLSRQ